MLYNSIYTWVIMTEQSYNFGWKWCFLAVIEEYFLNGDPKQWPLLTDYLNKGMTVMEGNNNIVLVGKRSGIICSALTGEWPEMTDCLDKGMT